MDPVVELLDIVDTLDDGDEPDPELIGDIGAGDLESLLRHNERELWPEIERLARSNPRFLRALGGVWAYESPMFEQREALLEELGESPRISVAFVGIKEDFSTPPLLGWRAVEVQGEAGSQLPRLLREIADWYERDQSAPESDLG